MKLLAPLLLTPLLGFGSHRSAARTYQVLLRAGDLIYSVDADHRPVGAAFSVPKDFYMTTLTTGQAVLVGKGDRIHPATLFFGDTDGHVAVAHGGAFIEPISDQTPDPNMPDYTGMAIYLIQGAVTISEPARTPAYAIRRKDGPRANSTRVIVKTKGVTTGAKGTLLVVSYLPTAGAMPGKTVVSNYETAESRVFWNGSPVYNTLASRGWTLTFAEAIGGSDRYWTIRQNPADPQSTVMTSSSNSGRESRRRG